VSRSTFRLALALLVLTEVRAAANVGTPWRPGDRAGEPAGVTSVNIAGEKLVLDLRRLASGGPAVVEARYQLYNPASEVAADLVFVAGSRLDEASEVWLDDKSVAHTKTTLEKLPESWKPPPSTPRIGAGRPLVYRTGANQCLAFAVKIPTGAHTLRVRYEARASSHRSGEATRYWQLAYILAPARDWKSFGTLDVQVQLPAGWAAVSEPALEHDGDELTGTFTGLPADALALTVQAPAQMSAWVGPAVGWTLWAVVLIGGAWIVWRRGAASGRRLAEQGHSASRAWLASIGVGVIWSGALALAALLAVTLATELPVPPHQDDIEAGYGAAWAVFFGIAFALFMLPVGLTLCQLAAYRARHRVIPS
jgi:hypothetical protein